MPRSATMLVAEWPFNRLLVLMSGRPNSRPVSTILEFLPDRMVRRVDTSHFE
ncbi:hypothetical protein F5Y13DRAFT_152812 [Hypoxylon sp. FL1857]|nr:hypothetical protein F5Y13DRAFT_152812 [Hypoxylon sp. FL1857]